MEVGEAEGFHGVGEIPFEHEDQDSSELDPFGAAGKSDAKRLSTHDGFKATNKGRGLGTGERL